MSNATPRDFHYIITPDKLQAACEHLAKGQWIALDTEFMRERHYYSRLCLIQAASETAIYCIDPLKSGDLSCFFQLLKDRRILKIFHAATQDMEILAHEAGQLPGPIFDTQIAAALLGHGDQTGYAALVKQLLDIKLDKSQTRTNWFARPLSAKQLDYAADDVRFLREIFLLQRATLESEGRLTWLEEECERLEQPEKYQLSPQALLKRVRGQQNLSTAQRAIARELAVWRENTARHKDKPRRWIIPDQAILELAESDVRSTDDLHTLENLKPGQIKAWGNTLLDCIRTARTLPESAWPMPERPGSLSPEQATRLAAIQKQIQAIAASTGISIPLIATRRDIECLLNGHRDIPLMQGWRHEITGQQIESILTRTDSANMSGER